MALSRQSLLRLAATSAHWRPQHQPRKKKTPKPRSSESQNPVGSITLIEFQNNVNYGYGPYLRDQYVLNCQPVVPFEVTPSLSLVARVITTFVDQPSFAPPAVCASTAGSASTFGIGDLSPPFFIAIWNAEGVPMMTGTDGKGDVPGEALQQEFREFSKGGLSPLKILQMTTVEPARFLHRSKDLGRIAPGMQADMVLLTANPLVRVENLSAISAVVHDGRIMTRERLDSAVRTLRSKN